MTRPRGTLPGSFGWAEQVGFLLARDHGINRRLAPAQLELYALQQCTATEAARRIAAAMGGTRRPPPVRSETEARPEPPPAPKQAKLFD